MRVPAHSLIYLRPWWAGDGALASLVTGCAWALTLITPFLAEEEQEPRTTPQEDCGGQESSTLSSECCVPLLWHQPGSPLGS